jgi:predicted dehydrogenase
MDRIRVGVIGCGYWGPNLIRNFAEIPESELVVVVDLREKRLAHIRLRYPAIQTTRDYKDLLSMGLDAVVIATPPATHFHIARDCLENGLHTLVEKPLTLSSRDAQALVDLADARDLRLMVGHTFEYNPAVRALKNMIESADLGQVYYVDSVRASLGLFQADLNVVWDLAPHDLSILRYILGADPICVRAQGAASVFQGKHDIAYLNLLYPGNILAHVHVSWLDPCKVRRITVVGSKKMVVYDDVETLEKIKVYDKGVERLPYTDTFGDFQCSYRYGDVVIPNIPFTEPLRVECQHFLECITEHREPQSCGRVGLNVVKTLEMATKSLENGGMQEMMSLE